MKDNQASGTATKHRAERKRKRRLFTRGRGMLHPSAGLGGRGAGLAGGGGVRSPLDKLDSGELIGVRVTEEISRQDSDLMLWHQKRDEGLCSMYASLEALMCSGWEEREEVAERTWAERERRCYSVCVCRGGGRITSLIRPISCEIALPQTRLGPPVVGHSKPEPEARRPIRGATSAQTGRPLKHFGNLPSHILFRFSD